MNDSPPEKTDWRLVLLSAAAVVTVVGSFYLALEGAGQAAKRHARSR